VRIGGKLPPLNPTATQVVAPAVAPDYVNPRLGSTLLPNGQKQYTFRGQPVFDAYAHGGPKPQKSAGHERQKIGSGGSHVVEAKHNPASPVLRKKTQEVQMDPEDLQEVMADAEVGNDITQLLLRGDDETRRMAQHFAIELLKEIRNGQPVFYTRKVNGFTLSDYFANVGDHPQLARTDIPAKLNELLAAIEWLHGKGFFHGDLHKGNVMYDRDTDKLVLIDMDAPKRAEVDRVEYDADVAFLRNSIRASLQSS